MKYYLYRLFGYISMFCLIIISNENCKRDINKTSKDVYLDRYLKARKDFYTIQRDIYAPGYLRKSRARIDIWFYEGEVHYYKECISITNEIDEITAINIKPIDILISAPAYQYWESISNIIHKFKSAEHIIFKCWNLDMPGIPYCDWNMAVYNNNKKNRIMGSIYMPGVDESKLKILSNLGKLELEDIDEFDKYIEAWGEIDGYLIFTTDVTLLSDILNIIEYAVHKDINYIDIYKLYSE